MMAILRYALIALSALCASTLLLVWVFSSNSAGIGNIIPLAFFLANLFYLIMSRPSLRTSDFLLRTSERFASASINLQDRAQEAQSREIEAEKRRLVEAELHEVKLQAAREMLQHFLSKLSLGQSSEAEPHLIAYHADAAQRPTSAPSPRPVADKGAPTNGPSLTQEPVPPVRPAPVPMPKVAPSAPVLN